MKQMREWLKKIIELPPRKFTKEEARAILVKYGVLDDKGNITPGFKDIFIKKEES